MWWYRWNPRSVKIPEVPGSVRSVESKRLGTFTLEKRSCETWSRSALCPCASRSLVRRFQFAIMKPLMKCTGPTGLCHLCQGAREVGLYSH